MKTLTKYYTAIDALIILLLLAAASSVQAEPGDIVIMRDVPPQRWEANRHTGQPTVVNPSPVKQTNTLENAVQSIGVTELTDQQFSGITSNVGSTSSPVNTTINTILTNQLNSQGTGGGSVGGQMGTVHGITSGIGGSVSRSVGGATGGLGGSIGGALSGLPGK